MPLLGTTTKQPGETELYAIFYGNDLGAGDSFVVESISIEDLSGDTLGVPIVESYLVDAPREQVKMFIKGGVAGHVYKVTTRIQTNSGRVLEDEFRLKIKDS